MTDDEFATLEADLRLAEARSLTGTPEEKRDAIPRAIRLRRQYDREARRRKLLARSAAASRG